MTELSSEIRDALYVACGFARNRNVETVVETFLAAARAEGARDMRGKIETLADLFEGGADDRCPSCGVDWGYFPDRLIKNSTCDHEEGMHHASSLLRALLADGGEPQ